MVCNCPHTPPSHPPARGGKSSAPIPPPACGGNEGGADFLYEANHFLSRIFIALIRIYAYAISPLMRGKCRFHPTCSAYAMEAIETHGAVKGGFLALRRLIRCHPWNNAPMLDPVPQSIDWKGIIRYNHAKPPTKE